MPRSHTLVLYFGAKKTISLRTRAIHESVRVGFVPNLEPAHRNRVEKKGTHRRPAGVIGSGGLEHQRMVGGSVGFGTARKRWKKHRSSENLTGFDEISSDLVKISPDLREIAPESGKISLKFGFFRRILGIFFRNLGSFIGFWKFWLESGNLSVGLDFSGFKGGKPKPDPPELVSGDEDPPPTHWSSQVGRFRSVLRVGRVLKWI